MKLLVVSHTPHYRQDGILKGWGPTVREIDHLSKLFDEVVHVAPLHRDAAPDSALGYESPRVRVCLVPPAGGPRVMDKLRILPRIPAYILAILRQLKDVDVVHVRCPSNISLVAILLISVLRTPRLRWLKYAGDWRPAGDGEPMSYAFQRWWLNRRLHRGVVTVNGTWSDQAAHVRTFLNPSLTDREVVESRAAAMAKAPAPPLRLLFVGRLEDDKGAERVLRIASILKRRGIPVTLDLAGDGPDRERYERLSSELEIDNLTAFHGWLARPDLGVMYARAHIAVLPSCTEGWPKVLSEAMAYGAVPIASSVSSIPGNLKRFGAGRTVYYADVYGFADAIAEYWHDPPKWSRESRNGMMAAQSFSYGHYIDAVRGILEEGSAN